MTWELEMSKENKDHYIEQLESLIKYQFAYNLLKKYWSYIPYEDRQEVDRELKEMGL
tara:strand:- start:651 stop:821 length:171 start_codon:yes stop_codon:yes gene_type:complete